jgi:hypothetical protein
MACPDSAGVVATNILIKQDKIFIWSIFHIESRVTVNRSFVPVIGHKNLNLRNVSQAFMSLATVGVSLVWL